MRRKMEPMNSIEDIKNKIAELNPEALFADGFDSAIIGYSRRINLDYVVCYSYNKCVDILISQNMTEEEALEYMEFNVVGAYVGESTPIFIQEIELL